MVDGGPASSVQLIVHVDDKRNRSLAMTKGSRGDEGVEFGGVYVFAHRPSICPRTISRSIGTKHGSGRGLLVPSTWTMTHPVPLFAPHALPAVMVGNTADRSYSVSSAWSIAVRKCQLGLALIGWPTVLRQQVPWYSLLAVHPATHAWSL